jgi:SAM-dependent methyltransferase
VGNDKTRQLYVDQHIRAFEGARILDIGCGPGDMLNYLPEVRYTGFDISPDYIKSARRRFGNRAQFYCEAVGTGTTVPADTYDIVIAHGVLHHLNDQEALSLFQIAHSALVKAGRLVTFDGCYTSEQSILARFFLSQDRGKYVRTQYAYEQLAKKVFSDVHTTVRSDLIKLPYTHIVMECSK